MLLEELGVQRVINATGVLTVLGGSVIDDEVMAAMQEVSKIYVDVPELQQKAGEYLANLLDVEAAFVTSGAAAGLVLAMGACMTGGKQEDMTRLPRTEGMRKNEAVVQKLHRNMYDYNLEIAGARIVDAGTKSGTTEEDLSNAITDRTAAVVYFMFDPQDGVLPLDKVIKMAHSRSVPVIVDGAAENPPTENLWKYYQMGADLVTFSGGKDIGGMNNTGLLIGRKELVQICVRLGPHSYEESPNGLRVYIGRPMKVSKEGIVGLVAAIRKYVRTDQDARIAMWNKRADYMVSELSASRGVVVRKMLPVNVDHPRPMTIPKVEVTLTSTKLRPESIEKELRKGDPPIQAYSLEGKLYINPQCLLDGDEIIVAKRLREVLDFLYNQQ